ncbi:Catsper1 [Symbiodinium sp. CCMP2456]|nr:Catsper1 [Symbiodinium sp. CCMP2456]
MVASQAFQALIDQLVNQHATELEALRAALARKDESPVLSPTLVTGMERMMTPMSMSSNLSYPGQWRNKRLSSQSALVDANTILEAWDEQEHQEMRDIHNQTRFSTSESDPPTRTERCQDFLVSATYEGVMAGVLVANMLWMAWTVQVQGEQIDLTDTSFGVGMQIWREIFYLGDAIFAGLYIGDACLRILGLGRQFWRTWMNCLDFVVAAFCVVEVCWLLSTDSSDVNFDFFRLLRVVKLTKALRMFSVAVGHAPLQLLVKCLEASRGMLFWSFCLLSLLQLLAGVVVSMLAAPYLLDDRNDGLMKEEVFRYYGTFSRTFLTMFEIMFANWGPACRVLVDNISEWFALFFLLYRCVFGFAVLNVVNSVFVQQTMKTATSDEELAFKQKEKDIAQYNRKVRKLFQTIDSSGDGAINLEEFEKLVQSPKLSFWMSQLELEYHDLLSLFEFLDNGDGQITLSEFIEGAGRLRGSAKALDIWRMETKIEVLFEEVFKILPQVWPAQDEHEDEEEDVGQQGERRCRTSRCHKMAIPSDLGRLKHVQLAEPSKRTHRATGTEGAKTFKVARFGSLQREFHAQEDDQRPGLTHRSGWRIHIFVEGDAPQLARDEELEIILTQPGAGRAFSMPEGHGFCAASYDWHRMSKP